MYQGYTVRLIPTKSQLSYFWKASNAARFIYNWSLAERKRLYTEENISETGYGMCKRLTELKKNPGYDWLNEVHNKVLKKAVLDCDEAFKKFFKGKSRFPKFHSKKNTIHSFYVESDIEEQVFIINGKMEKRFKQKIKFSRDNTVRLSGVGEVKLCKSAKKYGLWYLTEHAIPVRNCRVKYDGKYWNLTFSIEVPNKRVQLTDEVIGIDLGVKDTAICSNGKVYKNNNKSNKNIKLLEKRKKRYQRRISRKYGANKQGNKFIKTRNIAKLERKTREIDRRLRNIRKSYNHQVSRDIVNNKPKAIVMEKLNIQGMLKNKHLSKAIQQQNLYQLKQFIRYKAENQGTKFIEVPMNYKSTQICSSCGAINKISLSMRVYRCSICGLRINRDMNSAYNLRNYGINSLGA